MMKTFFLVMILSLPTFAETYQGTIRKTGKVYSLVVPKSVPIPNGASLVLTGLKDLERMNGVYVEVEGTRKGHELYGTNMKIAVPDPLGVSDGKYHSNP